MLLSEAISIWQKEYADTLRSAHTVIKQSKNIHLELGHISIDDLTSLDLTNYRDIRLVTVGPQTVIHELSVINRVLTYFQREKGHVFPSGAVPRTKNPKKPRGRDRRINGDELDRICSKFHDQRLRLLSHFAVQTGMRRTEICSILWTDINWQTCTVYVPKTKTDVPRTVPLSKEAQRLLRGVQRAFPREERVFPYNPDCLTVQFIKARKRAGVEGLRFHDLRHEATSRFFELGLNMMEVSTITGHQDLASLQRYTHLKAESLVDRLG